MHLHTGVGLEKIQTWFFLTALMFHYFIQFRDEMDEWILIIVSWWLFFQTIFLDKHQLIWHIRGSLLDSLLGIKFLTGTHGDHKVSPDTGALPVCHACVQFSSVTFRERKWWADDSWAHIFVHLPVTLRMQTLCISFAYLKSYLVSVFRISEFSPCGEKSALYNLLNQF